jgi:hypothetical protein
MMFACGVVALIFVFVPSKAWHGSPRTSRMRWWEASAHKMPGFGVRYGRAFPTAETGERGACGRRIY